MILLHVSVVVTLFAVIIADSCPPNRQLLRKGLDASQQQKIVDRHNYLRNKVAGGRMRTEMAQNMRELKWDPKLADTAQYRVEHCAISEDWKYKNRWPVRLFNLALGSTNPKTAKLKNIERMVDAWFRKKGPLGARQNYRTYMQMIWAETSLVGCGHVGYKMGELYTTELACDYSPGASLAYVPGQRNCELFNLSNSTKYDSLCISD